MKRDYKNKMIAQNILLQVDNDLNSLCHEGVKRMHWYQHDPNRRYQRQAAYAKGQPNPDAKTSVGDKVKKVATSVKNAAGNAYARAIAKNDAAWEGAGKSNKLTKGDLRIAANAVGLGAATTAASALIGKKIASSKANKQYVKPEDWRLEKPMQVSYKMPGSDSTYTINADTFRGARLAGRMQAHGEGVLDVKPYQARLSNEFLSRASAERAAAVTRAGNFGRAVGSIAGVVPGIAVGKAYINATYKGYLKRGQGQLTRTKMSPMQQQVYKDTFNKYKEKYSEPVSIAGRTFRID